MQGSFLGAGLAVSPHQARRSLPGAARQRRALPLVNLLADVMGNSERFGYKFRLLVPRGPIRSQTRGQILALFSCPLCSRRVIQDICVRPLKAMRTAALSLCNVSAASPHMARRL